MITQEYLLQLFEYDGKNLIWKETRGMAKKGAVAGTINSRGYRHIRIDNIFYQAHRLIWIYVNGFLEDDKTIDHIDRNRENNAIENLRKCLTVENNLNRGASTASSTGVKNIYKTKSGLFYVECRLYGKQHRTAKFKTLEEAKAVRDSFVKGIHKAFATETVA